VRDPATRLAFKRALKSRPPESIEEILDRLAAPGNLSAESAGQRFVFAIASLFCAIEWDVNYEPLDVFLGKQLGIVGTSHSFISFNYDLILDRAIQRKSNGQWDVATDYGFPISEWIEADPPQAGGRTHQWADALPLSQRSSTGRIQLLKPHGSLNWFIPDRERFPVVTLTGAGELRYSCSTAPFQRIKRLDSDPIDVNQCVVPPRLTKDLQWQFLGDIRQRERESVAQAVEIYIVGWSMPTTDTDQEQLLRMAVCGQQLERVTVVTKGGSNEYFDRIGSAVGLARSQLRVYNAGFADFASTV
jgi:hypothetical protein